jgi:hypothetical protein
MWVTYDGTFRKRVNSDRALYKYGYMVNMK